MITRILHSGAGYEHRMRIWNLAKFMLWAVAHLLSNVVQLAELSFVNHVAYCMVCLSPCLQNNFYMGSHCSVFCNSFPVLKTIQG